MLWNLKRAKVQSQKWGAGVSTEKSWTLPSVNWAWIKHKVYIMESGNFYSAKCVGIMYTKCDSIKCKVGFY